ncbi:MAG: hypothetical protein J6Q61_00610 [Bacteroidales bacterium]|nr:hypothetical protein [Bacteroidales bacterium]
MIKALKYKNEVMEGFFISEEGKIYDGNGNEQEQKLYSKQSKHPYYHFKGKAVHNLMCHSFFRLSARI